MTDELHIPGSVPRIAPPRRTSGGGGGLSGVVDLLERGDYDTEKFDLGKRMDEKRIHPVLIFGTSESGKSTMLLSLLNYGEQSPKLAARVSGEPILPESHSDREKYHSEAQAFFARDINTFRLGNLIHLTQREEPLFIPIDVQARSGPKIRFAFLEGDGEWYARQPVVDPGNFRPMLDLKRPIAQILNSYAGGISMIFVAPTFEANPAKPINHAWNSLTELMRIIAEKRRNVSSADNLLLMLSMWDGRNSPGDPNGRFYGATSEAALSALGGANSNVWAAFTRLTAPTGGSKAMMPYSAAWINNKSVLNNSQHKPTFDRFNETVWNWLYGNACQSLLASPSNGIGVRSTLFPEVVVPDPEPLRWHERLTRRIIVSRL
jgi:hypothetical protein